MRVHGVFLILTVVCFSVIGQTFVVVWDTGGLINRYSQPVSIRVDLRKLPWLHSRSSQLELTEDPNPSTKAAMSIPVQFEPDTPASLKGDLQWLMPPADKRDRRFVLRVAKKTAPPALTITCDSGGNYYNISEGTSLVLRYNHGTVPVPSGIPTNYARGDYIMPLIGLEGEVLTDDYPKDHPHHRGIGWSWPVTRWGNEVRDIWAIRGVWARPVSVPRMSAGSVCATLRAKSHWKWGDQKAIVEEEVMIRAFRRSGVGRYVDIEIKLTALVDDVAIGGRPEAGYGGFGLRAAPSQERVIAVHTDPPGSKPLRSWIDYSGVFPGGNDPSGLAILEHVNNPLYPNKFHQYPDLNFVMPAFPGPREMALDKGKPLLLRHRLWIHSGSTDEHKLADVWSAYANPPKVIIKH